MYTLLVGVQFQRPSPPVTISGIARVSLPFRVLPSHRHSPQRETVGRRPSPPPRFTPPPGHGCADHRSRVTVDANAAVTPIRNRVPVILPPDRFEPWLAGEDVPLDPYPPESMTVHPVSTHVNTSRRTTTRGASSASRWRSSRIMGIPDVSRHRLESSRTEAAASPVPKVADFPMGPRRKRYWDSFTQAATLLLAGTRFGRVSKGRNTSRGKTRNEYSADSA